MRGQLRHGDGQLGRRRAAIRLDGDGPGSATIATDTSASPVITFDSGIGDYALSVWCSVVVSNAECAGVSWDTLVRVSEPPVVTLGEVPDTCEQVTFTPDIAYGIPDSFIDSVRWEVVDGQGDIVFASGDFYPADISIGTPGSYALSVTAYNGCGSSVASEAFALLEGPRPQFAIDTNFVCVGSSVTVTDSSGGDNLEYLWTVTGPGSATITTPTSASPTITFDSGIGDYTLSVVVSNAECAGVSWDTLVRVSEPPVATLGEVPDTCEQATFTPEIAYGIPDSFIDSVRWEVVDGQGDIIFASGDFYPVDITVGTPGNYVLSVTAYNGCGSSVASEAFALLEGPRPQFAIDTNFVCVGNSIAVTDSSGGDNLEYLWTVTGPGSATITTSTSASPTITFDSGIGDYTLSVVVSNAECAGVSWDTLVRVSEPPVAALGEVPDTCEQITFTPEIAYGIPDSFIDSVRWEVVDGQGDIVFASVEFYPTGISIGTPGNYTLSVTAYNGCGSSVATELFALLEGPSPQFAIDTNFVCVGSSVTVTDSSGGDALQYAWTVSGPGSVTIATDTSASPVITFDSGIGDYILSVVVSNAECAGVSWDTLVRVSQPPVATLGEVPDTCEQATFTPEIAYGIPDSFIDSVRWEVVDGQGDIIFASGDFYPVDITVGTPGNYTLSVTAYNGCGSSVATEPFALLEGPSPQFAVDTNFVCVGSSVTVTDSSGGDALQYAWTVSGPGSVTIATDTSASPTITFDSGIGDYALSVVVSNAECAGVSWDTLVRVSEPPVVTLGEVPDACEQVTFTPDIAYGIPDSFIDSVRWEVVDGQGDIVFASGDFYPADISIGTPGSYALSVTAYNGCGSSRYGAVRPAGRPQPAVRGRHQLRVRGQLRHGDGQLGRRRAAICLDGKRAGQRNHRDGHVCARPPSPSTAASGTTP
ncbi:MAG: PKD domain-containing protein [Lewinellaceae bacterium]|nr:PKD domain-containing protein [Lewinellaceae bacterium]